MRREQAGLCVTDRAAGLGEPPGFIGTLLHRAEAAFEQAYGPADDAPDE